MADRSHSELIRVGDAARELDVSTRRLLDLIDTGRLAAYNRDDLLWVDLDEARSALGQETR